MTANQIAYKTAMEKERNNFAMERETNRHNVAIEAIQQSNVDVANRVADETNRHNKVMEGLQSYAHALTAQYNQAVARHYEAQDRISATKLEIDKQLGTLQILGQQLNSVRDAQTKLDTAKLQSGTTMYTAQLNAETSRYSADKKYAASIYSSDTSRRNTNVNAATSIGKEVIDEVGDYIANERRIAQNQWQTVFKSIFG